MKKERNILQERNIMQILKVIDPKAYDKMRAMIRKPCSNCQEWECDGCENKKARNFLEEDDGREDF